MARDYFGPIAELDKTKSFLQQYNFTILPQNNNSKYGLRSIALVSPKVDQNPAQSLFEILNYAKLQMHEDGLITNRIIPLEHLDNAPLFEDNVFSLSTPHIFQNTQSAHVNRMRPGQIVYNFLEENTSELILLLNKETNIKPITQKYIHRDESKSFYYFALGVYMALTEDKNIHKITSNKYTGFGDFAECYCRLKDDEDIEKAYMDDSSDASPLFNFYMDMLDRDASLNTHDLPDKNSFYSPNRLLKVDEDIENIIVHEISHAYDNQEEVLYEGTDIDDDLNPPLYGTSNYLSGDRDIDFNEDEEDTDILGE